MVNKVNGEKKRGERTRDGVTKEFHVSDNNYTKFILHKSHFSYLLLHVHLHLTNQPSPLLWNAISIQLIDYKKGCIYIIVNNNNNNNNKITDNKLKKIIE